MTDLHSAEQGIVAAAMRAQRMSMLFTAVLTVGLAGSIGTFLYYGVTELHRVNAELSDKDLALGQSASTIQEQAAALSDLKNKLAAAQQQPAPTPAPTFAPPIEPTPVPDVPVDFAKLSADWASAWSARNVDAVMAFYTSDTELLLNQGGRLDGTSNVRGFVTGAFAATELSLTLNSVKTGQSGTLAFDSGTYDQKGRPVSPAPGGRGFLLRGSPQLFEQQGSYLFVYQRQPSGDWKILEQSFNLVLPAPR